MALKLLIAMNIMANSICEKLTEAKLRRLGEHKYSSNGRTFLDPLMQPFWNWFVEKLPFTLAPNLMTLLGLACNIITALILVYYSPDAKQEIPRLPLFMCAIGLFVYQTLDACDGKQARRTSSNSPLGELFDHGCDAISTIFVSLSVCEAVQLGYSYNWMVCLCVSACALFYVAHWQTYVTGTLRFGKFDVTEAQMTIIAVLVISGICGTQFWSKNLFNLIELKDILVYFTIIGAVYTCINYFSFILAGGVGKNGSSVAGTSVLSPCTPLILAVVLSLTIFGKSMSHLFIDHLCLYIITFGLVIAKITNRVVVAHMSRTEITKLDTILLGPAALFLNQYFNTIIDEYILLWIVLIYTVIDLSYYSYSTCHQIASYLNIRILSIAPLPPRQHNSHHSREQERVSNGRERHKPYHLRSK